MNDVEQMLINEYNKTERAIKARQSQIAALKAEVKKEPLALTRRPKVYQVEFDYAPGDLQTQQKTFTVDGATIFRPVTIGTSLRVIGEAASGQVAQITIGYGIGPLPGGFGDAGSYRNENFDFFWRIRDTGSDREWQNEWQPSVFLMSGHITPLWLPIAGRINGGSEVSVEIDPIINRAVASELFNTVSSFRLTFQFHGSEEPAK